MRQAILRPVVAQIYGGEKVKPGDKSTGYSFIYGKTICGGRAEGLTWNGASGVHIVR